MSVPALITDPKYKVTVHKESALTYPELWMGIHVSGPAEDQRGFNELFVRSHSYKEDDPMKADLVVFSGGSDVNPIYYDETPHSSTRWSTERDLDDIDLYETCLHNGIPMFGVCRGAQFLHVMNGGKLYQDIDNHVGDHAIWDTTKQVSIEKVSSVHHQACIPNPDNGMILLASTTKSRNRWLDNKDKMIGLSTDVEAYFYRDTCCLGVQGHPEYRGYHRFAQWTLELIKELIVENTDITLIDGHHRLKTDVRAQRDAAWAKKAKELN